MGKWIIFDLRNNHCFIQLAEENEGNIKPVGEPFKIKVIASIKTHDGNDISEPDLCFYREVSSKRFLFVSPDEVKHPLSNKEIILELFKGNIEISNEIIESCIKSGLFRSESILNALRYLKNDHKLLCLVDSLYAYKVLFKVIQETGKFLSDVFKIIYVPGGHLTYAGFALLSEEQNSLPENNKEFFYKEVKENTGLSDNNGKSFSFIWRDNHFVRSDNSSSISHNKGISDKWKTEKELERYGAVSYALYWKSILDENTQIEINLMKRNVKEISNLLTQARSLSNKLKKFGYL